jgi:hypothetical protein
MGLAERWAELGVDLEASALRGTAAEQYAGDLGAQLAHAALDGREGKAITEAELAALLSAAWLAGYRIPPRLVTGK